MHTKRCFFCIFIFVISFKRVWKFDYLFFFARISFREYVLAKNSAKISFCKITQNLRNSQKLLLLRYFIVNKMKFCLKELWNCILHITCMRSSFCSVLVYISLHFRPNCFLQHYIFMFLCVCVFVSFIFRFSAQCYKLEVLWKDLKTFA